MMLNSSVLWRNRFGEADSSAWGTWSIPDGYKPPVTFGAGPMPAHGLPIYPRRMR
jgi:hypothetical protein